MKQVLFKKIRSREAKVAVTGLGYVGLPLAKSLYLAGFEVTGVDLEADRILREKGTEIPFPVTSSFEPLKESDVTVICVPTPVDRHRVPDMSAIQTASEQVLQLAPKGSLIILESTTYPGTTREFLIEPFQKKGWKPGKDVFIAYCPERLDPGNKTYSISNTPRVIGGATPACGKLAKEFYRSFVNAELKLLSSPESAEMTKIFENVFRNVNIALVNELAILCRKMNIDVWEVIEGASTKPFGFMPFYPGPGVGGHCIPVDPFYLAYRARAFGVETRFIHLAGEINESMPAYVVSRIGEILNEMGRAFRGSNILIVGVTYKPDVDDLRHSPALEIISKLLSKGCRVNYFDPYVPTLEVASRKLRSLSRKSIKSKNFHLAVIITPHTDTPYHEIIQASQKVLDTRGVLRGKKNLKVEFL